MDPGVPPADTKKPGKWTHVGLLGALAVLVFAGGTFALAKYYDTEPASVSEDSVDANRHSYKSRLQRELNDLGSRAATLQETPLDTAVESKLEKLVYELERERRQLPNFAEIPQSEREEQMAQLMGQLEGLRQRLLDLEASARDS